MITKGTRVYDIALGKTGTVTEYHPPVRFNQQHGEWDYVTDDGHEHTASASDLVPAVRDVELPDDMNPQNVNTSWVNRLRASSRYGRDAN